MWWLIARPESRLVDFTWLHTTPKVIDFWTHAVVFFELTFPILIWIPLARPLLLGAGARRLDVAGAGHRRHHVCRDAGDRQHGLRFARP